ncbi:MAG: hypothetical protein R2789_13460 [Microthrixaceae bacterium]
MTCPAPSGLFVGLARLVTKHPVVIVAAAVLVMVVLASPVRDLRPAGWAMMPIRPR